jgi:hypothetical protein
MGFPRSRILFAVGLFALLDGAANAQAPGSSPLGGGPPGGGPPGRPGGLGFIVADSPEGCAQAWISIDRDGDGSISRRDALLTIQSEFANLSKDARGEITAETWVACEGNPVFAGALPPTRTPPTGEPIDPWTNDADFAASDANGDGLVTKDEAIAAEKARYLASETSRPEDDVARASGRRFLMYDRDSDGALSQAEWAARGEADVGFRFARFDFDKSGGVDLDEWVLEARKVLLVSASEDGSIDLWRFYYGF